ncbi:hypothetical protein GCM10010216_53770 [Streptomyces flaveolus]|nr:hypothetical protein GCM10010216_53770 [Streptomyces flaveolus]
MHTTGCPLLTELRRVISPAGRLRHGRWRAGHGLAATRDHLDAARIRAAAHAYLRRVLALWRDTADWTDRARTAYLEEHHALHTAKGGPPPGPPETQAQVALRAVLAPSPNPRRYPVTRPRPCGAATPAGGAEQAAWTPLRRHPDRIRPVRDPRPHLRPGTQPPAPRTQLPQPSTPPTPHHAPPAAPPPPHRQATTRPPLRRYVRALPLTAGRTGA